MRALLGTILMCSATALAAPGDAPPPAPMGPSGSAAPVNPYQQGPVTSPTQTQGPVTTPSQVPTPPPDTSSGAPAPSQQQAPAKAPEPGTQQEPAKAQEPPVENPRPPASEGKANPVIDKPAPAPVDTPAPAKDTQSSREPTGSATKSDAPGNIEPNGPAAPGNTAPSSDEPGASNAPGNGGTSASNAPGNVEPTVSVVVEQLGPVIDVENAPPACRDAGKLAQSRDRNAAQPARISFAICTANAALAPMQLVDAEASVQEVDTATTNSFALLEEVAAAGDPKWAIVALHAAGDLLATMTKRMLDTVAASQPAELRDMRTQMLQPHLQPWIERTQKAFAEVDRLAKANPQLAKNQVVATAVSDSRKRMATGVATR